MHAVPTHDTEAEAGPSDHSSTDSLAKPDDLLSDNGCAVRVLSTRGHGPKLVPPPCAPLLPVPIGSSALSVARVERREVLA